MMVQDTADDDWLVRADSLRLPGPRRSRPRLRRPRIRATSRGLVVADRHPDLAIVVDHGAKPFIRERRLDPWRADMAALAARPNVVCKLSGLATEAAADWRPEDLRPYVDHLMGAFGAGRLLWGSDWPVVNLAGGYDRWRAASLEWLQGCSESEREAVLGGSGADLSRRPGRR
jgi:L-fuconolactonase